MNAGTFKGAGDGVSAPVLTALVRSPDTLPSGVVAAAGNASCLQAAATTSGIDINVLRPIFTLQGKGVVNWAGMQSYQNAGTFRGSLEIDGVVVCNQQGPAGGNEGVLLVGSLTAAFQPIYFKSSMRMLYASTVSSQTVFGFLNAEVYE